MANLCICRNPTLIRKDWLVRDIFTKNNNIFTSFPTIFQAQTLAFILTSAPTLATTSTLNPRNMYTNVDL